MPQTGYWPQQYYTSTATTTNYIPANYTWSQTPSYQTTVATSDLAWLNWNATSTIITQNTYANQVWVQWNQTPYTPPVYTPEQLREMEAQQARQRAIYEERNQRRSAARAKARTLLEQFLDDEQKLELERHGRFYVTGSKGRRYCIRAEGQSGNVDLLKPDGSIQARLCCHPRQVPGESYELLPEGDAWLMQMIEIRHDEDHFLRTANVHRGSLPALA